LHLSLNVGRRKGNAVLEVDLRHDYGAFRLSVAFQAATGGITALFGRSGSGKTSVVNMLAGLQRPQSGHIRLDGVSLFESGQNLHMPPERRRLGYVFQDGRLFPHLSVRANLNYGRRLNPPAEGAHFSFDRVVDLLGLGGLLDRRPHRLSGGEKQRVAIGRALLANPRLILMDEPLAALDQARKEEILPYIEKLRDEMEIPIVLVSHAVEEIVRLADTVIALDQGRVLAAGPMEEVMSRLDVVGEIGGGDVGSVVAAQVLDHDFDHHLTRLAFGDQILLVPLMPQLIAGAQVRARVRARDVAIALEQPKGISVLNMFPGIIREIREPDPSQRDVLLDVGVPLWSRVSAMAAESLCLTPGQTVHALVKAVSIDRRTLGHVPQNDLS